MIVTVNARYIKLINNMGWYIKLNFYKHIQFLKEYINPKEIGTPIIVCR